jgi:hypothetical protein
MQRVSDSLSFSLTLLCTIRSGQQEKYEKETAAVAGKERAQLPFRKMRRVVDNWM